MNKRNSILTALVCSFTMALVGVAIAGATDERETEAKKIVAALAQLPDADRLAAEAQRWCAVKDDNRLGSMGPPVKVFVNGKAVFLCCAACKAKATANGPATIAKAAELKKANAATAKLSADDRSAAEAQRFCAVMEKSRLGTMGAPVKLTVYGQPVFLCCKACVERAQADPKATLAKVAKLKKAGESSE
jgi:hypothetical protein